MTAAIETGTFASRARRQVSGRGGDSGRVLIPLLKFFIFLQVCAVVSLFFTRYSKALVDRYFNRGEITVPALADLSLENALQVAEASNLGIKIVETRYSLNVPDNHIVSQAPDPGGKVRPGRKIHVVLSKGAFLVAAPEVVGKPFRTAGIILRNEGFSLGKTAYIHDVGVFVDTVICQTPRENSMVPKSTSIDLLVSLGKMSRMVKVPNFIGLTLDEAKSLMNRTGLLTGKISYTLENMERRNTILAQLPKKDLTVDEGATVDFLLNGERPPEEASRELAGGGAEYGEWAEQTVRARAAVPWDPVKRAMTAEAVSSIERGLQQDFEPGSATAAAGSTSLSDSSGTLLPGFDGSIGGQWPDAAGDKSTLEWEVKDSAVVDGLEDFDSSDFGSDAEGFGYFSSAMKKQVLLEYVVPGKDNRAKVQMVLIDSKGISKIYDSVHSAGEKLAVEATGYGKVKILIYVNRELVTQRDY